MANPFPYESFQLKRDEHDQLLSLVGMSSDDLSDEIANAETRMINLDTALALHETRVEAGAIPEDEILSSGLWAAGAEGSRRHQQGYLDWLKRRLGKLNRTSKEARATSHQGVFVSVARQKLSTEQFNSLQEETARQLNNGDEIQDQVAERLEEMNAAS